MQGGSLIPIYGQLIVPVEKSLFFKWNTLACFLEELRRKGYAEWFWGEPKGNRVHPFCPHARCVMLLRSLQGPDEVKEALTKLWMWEGVDRGGPIDLHLISFNFKLRKQWRKHGRMTQWGRGGRRPAGAHMCVGRHGWAVGFYKSNVKAVLAPKRGEVWDNFSVTLVVLLAGVFAGWSEQVCLRFCSLTTGTSPRQFLSHSCKDCLCRWC